MTKKAGIEGYHGTGREVRATYEFYLDVFWVTNLVMDGAALILTGLVGRDRISPARIALAAAFGATSSACLFLWLSSFPLYQLLLHALVNPAMVRIGFSWKGWPGFLRQILEAYLTTLILGGCIAWLWPAHGPEGLFWLCAAVGVAICGLSALRAWARQRQERLYEVLLIAGGRRIPLKGLYDTGNLLSDPMLHQPVHIIRQDLLTQEEGRAMHYIPYHSLGNERGLLPVVVIEGMYVSKNGKRGGGARYIEKPVCGMAEESLFSGRPYQMILNGMGLE